jgi:predicted small lipoprotein YifL
MHRGTLFLTVAVTVAALVACGKAGPKAPDRETVTKLLRQEAESFKKEGERIDPNLGVAATWNIDAVVVTERPGDAAKPWNGTVRFKIESRTREPDGSTTTDRLEKKFDYVFDAASGRWFVR